MKRIYGLLLAIIFLLLFASCNGKGNTQTSSAGSEDETGTEAPTQTEPTTEMPPETTTESPVIQEPETGYLKSTTYTPGTIVLDPAVPADYAFEPHYRFAYYNIPSIFSDLATPEKRSEYFDLIERTIDVSKEPREMELVSFIKYCGISREDFDKAVQKDILFAKELGIDTTEEEREIPNANVIYTFDNELINYYYRRE